MYAYDAETQRDMKLLKTCDESRTHSTWKIRFSRAVRLRSSVNTSMMLSNRASMTCEAWDLLLASSLACCSAVVFDSYVAWMNWSIRIATLTCAPSNRVERN